MDREGHSQRIGGPFSPYQSLNGRDGHRWLRLVCCTSDVVGRGWIVVDLLSTYDQSPPYQTGPVPGNRLTTRRMTAHGACPTGLEGCLFGIHVDNPCCLPDTISLLWGRCMAETISKRERVRGVRGVRGAHLDELEAVSSLCTYS